MNDPDWIRYAEEMIDVARETYRIAQTRNQEAVAEATGNCRTRVPTAYCFETVITLTLRSLADSAHEPSSNLIELAGWG